MSQEINREDFLGEIEKLFKAQMNCIRHKTEKTNFKESDGVEAVVNCSIEAIENTEKFVKHYYDLNKDKQ